MLHLKGEVRRGEANRPNSISSKLQQSIETRDFPHFPQITLNVTLLLFSSTSPNLVPFPRFFFAKVVSVSHAAEGTKRLHRRGLNINPTFGPSQSTKGKL